MNDRRDWLRRRVDASPLFTTAPQRIPPGLGYRWTPADGLRWEPRAKIRAKRWILTGRVARRHDPRIPRRRPGRDRLESSTD